VVLKVGNTLDVAFHRAGKEVIHTIRHGLDASVERSGFRSVALIWIPAFMPRTTSVCDQTAVLCQPLEYERMSSEASS
jgi:hypothetical protein